MKTESEINDKIRYTQGYLDGLWFTLGKTEAEIKQGVVRIQEDVHTVKEREASRFFAPIGITAGLATFFFGFALQPRNWFDMWAGIILMGLGFIGAGVYFHLLKKSLERNIT
jgi:hypothetical protein